MLIICNSVCASLLWLSGDPDLRATTGTHVGYYRAAGGAADIDTTHRQDHVAVTLTNQIGREQKGEGISKERIRGAGGVRTAASNDQPEIAGC